MKKIRDELATKCFYEQTTSSETGFKLGWDAAMERVKILEEALKKIANTRESAFHNRHNIAKSALAKFRGEE